VCAPLGGVVNRDVDSFARDGKNLFGADAREMRVMSVSEGTQPDDVGLRVRTDRSSRTITLEGELDLASKDQLVEAIDPLLQGPDPVTLELEGLRFMDSSGLRAVIQAARRATTLVLLNPRGQVDQLLRLCDLERLENVTIEGALDG
jgi:anti-anti-sigma factor